MTDLLPPPPAAGAVPDPAPASPRPPVDGKDLSSTAMAAGAAVAAGLLVRLVFGPHHLLLVLAAGYGAFLVVMALRSGAFASLRAGTEPDAERVIDLRTPSGPVARTAIPDVDGPVVVPGFTPAPALGSVDDAVDAHAPAVRDVPGVHGDDPDDDPGARGLLDGPNALPDIPRAPAARPGRPKAAN